MKDPDDSKLPDPEQRRDAETVEQLVSELTAESTVPRWHDDATRSARLRGEELGEA